MRLRFSQNFTSALPADTQNSRQTRQVSGALFAFVTPESLERPRLLLWSDETAEMLGLDANVHADLDAVSVLSGNLVAQSSAPYATVYGGHQFGNWAGQLGDGRAINLGEIGDYTLQLKGAGRTPFSRHADGRAVLRSSIREFLCSEAMHHLGIASTRALSLIAGESTVQRDMFYDGNPRDEYCAVVCRVSQSFLRFGHFELPAAREDFALLKRLTDYAIHTHFPNINAQDKLAPAQMFAQICRNTASLVAHWMSVGFVHGVMNTDNMSILSETIDYGPYGWLEKYDLQWTPNTTDAEGRRYCYGNQPAIAQWNLARLGNALYPLIEDVEPLQQALNAYNAHFHAEWNRLLAMKLGLRESVLLANPECYRQLVNLLSTLDIDFNLFFDALTRIAARDGNYRNTESMQALLACSYQEAPESALLNDWLLNYEHWIVESKLPDRAARMRAANPVFILRNHLVQDVIDAAEQGDYKPLQDIFTRLKTPYADDEDDARWIRKCPPESMQRAGCSMLSCSS